jgi:hypothetical protein
MLADRRVASCEKRTGNRMSKPEIASREEVLAMLTEKARKGQTGAMIALERALRAAERKEREALDNELDRILAK